MRVKIYQIDIEKDTERRKFRSLKDGETVDSSTYELVFDDDIVEHQPETIYRRFNTECHPGFIGHPLSVSDVVNINNQFFYCQNIGFKEIAFDEAAASRAFYEERIKKQIN